MQEETEQTVESTIIPEKKKFLNEKPLKEYRISIQLIT